MRAQRIGLTAIEVRVRLFRFIGFSVEFPAISLDLPDAVYVQHLGLRESCFAWSRQDAEAGRWVV